MSSWQHHQEKGKESYSEQDFATSLTHFREASRLASLNATRKEQSMILSQIVSCRLRIGGAENLFAGLEEAKECVSLDDKWPKAYMTLASVYIALGEHDRRHGHSNDACQALQTVIRLDPSNATARTMLMREMRRGIDTTPGTASSHGREQSNNGGGSSAQQEGGEHTNADESVPPQPSYDDVDETWANDDRDNRLRRPRWFQVIYETLDRVRDWFDNLSENGKSLTKVGLALLILYICLGGRFGFESKDMNPYRQGSYGDGLAYERFYNNNHAGRRTSYDNYSAGDRGGGGGTSGYSSYDSYGSRNDDDGSQYYDSYSYGSHRSSRRSNRSSRYQSDDGTFFLVVMAILVCLACHAAGIPIHVLPLGLGFGMGRMNVGLGRGLGGVRVGAPRFPRRRFY